MVTGDGHGHREFQVAASRESAAGPWFLRPRAERLTPEWLTTVAVTRHPKLRHRHKKAPELGG